jgi:kumamolisin
MPPARSRPVRMENTARPHRAGARRARPADPADELVVVLVLRHRPDLPEPPGMAHWAATPHAERQFLDGQAAADRHGAAAQDADRVTAWAQASGLRVDEASLARRLVQVSGPAARFDAAFGITLSMYETPAETYRGYEGDVSLPADVAQVVLAVFGLDSRRLAERAGGPAITPALSLTPLSPPDVAGLYGFGAVPPAISGQTIGIFEFGGGYVTDSGGHATDVNAFFAGLTPPLPAPHLTAPVSVLGGANTVLGGPGNVSNDDAEVALDIDVAGSVASGATIAVYFIGSSSDIGWILAIAAAVVPAAGQPSPSVLTISWAWREDDWSATQLAAMTGFFQLAAAKGVTVLAASGDKGSMGNADEPDGRAHVCFPACDPWVTAVGGTTIGDVSGPAFSEVTWNDNGVTAGGISTVTDSSGSLVFPRPAWQAGIGVPPSVNDGTTRGRGLPDLAGYSNGYDIRLYGADAGVWWGTSEASPLYAGLVAVLNARLGHRLGYLNPTLYALAQIPGWSIFRDIDDDGSNAFSFTLPPPSAPTVITSPGYTAGPGWDACTGWGSIRADRLYAALAGLPILATAIASGGDLGHACAGSWADGPLTINNTGFGMLAVAGIVSSSPDFLVPEVSSYPLLISAGGSAEVVVRFRPAVAGPAAATLALVSDDPSSPHLVGVAGTGGGPRLSVLLAGAGNFGPARVGAFTDEPVTLANSGRCALQVTAVTSSSGEFLAPETESYPLVIGPGAALPLPVRFAPSSPGDKSATLTVWSDDPAGPRPVTVTGTAPCEPPCAPDPCCAPGCGCGRPEPGRRPCCAGR